MLTPERAVTRTNHLGVSPRLLSDKDIYLLRDYRPTFGVSAGISVGATLVFFSRAQVAVVRATFMYLICLFIMVLIILLPFNSSCTYEYEHRIIVNCLYR